MTAPQKNQQGQSQSEWVRVDSAFRTADGKPRFAMTVPRATLEDAGVRVMVQEELRGGGYEFPTRRFIDAHLEPDDLFIDVGAHWGIFTLHAATLHRGRTRVFAIEAHPGNIAHLIRGVVQNKLGGVIEAVGVAAGAVPGTAPLIFNSTMGHSLYGKGLPDWAQRTGKITVPILPLDLMMDERPDLAERRVIMKVDVEGFEPEVMQGAERLLASGRVRAVIWEHGWAFRQGERRDAMNTMLASFERHGFRQSRFPHPSMGGPLVPFAPTPEAYNVFALAPDLKPLPCYAKANPKPESLSTLTRAPDDAALRAETTEVLIAAKATDATRWADFDALKEGADERAKRALPLIPAGAHVLDVGAGAMALKFHLPTGCRYTPADLVPFDADTVVVDLNQGQFPEGSFGAVVLLDVLEFVHAPEAVLAAAAKAAPVLVASYRPADGMATEDRRKRGYFTDLTADAFEALLVAAGWSVSERIDADGTRLVRANRR